MADKSTPVPAGQQPRALATGEDEPTIGRLVKDLTTDVQSLVQQLIALVKSEVKITVTTSGIGIGLFLGAAFFGLLGIILLSFGFVWLLSMTGLHLAWCFLIVFGVYVLIAALLGLVGARKMKQVGPPKRSIHQAQETKNLLKR